MKKFTMENLVYLLTLIQTLVNSTATAITNAYEALIGPIGNDSEGNKHTVKSFVESAISTVNGAATALESRVKAIEDEKGVANGLASLDETGHIPSSQLPSFVDDVIEATDKSALPAIGESGKIYVTLNDNLTYRWSGSQYVEISQSLALGETSSTAYAGDKGKKNADAIAAIAADYLTSTDKAGLENEITELADGQVKTNKEAIDAINHETTGILALAKSDATTKASTAELNAKSYADAQIAAIEAYTESEIQKAWNDVFNATE